MKRINNFLKEYKIELIIFLIAIIFSYWLMFSTFSYNQGRMEITSKAWSDFASHIPLIRSFSFGDNFPPEYPLFSGPPIRYHFLFFLFVGLLEKLGIGIDYALNVPSLLGFAFIILIIYVFSKKIFDSVFVGILSILFFVFNGSLDFIKFFGEHPLSTSSLSDIISNQRFVSFGPYDGSTISAFWNLNIYTNQRHLSFSYTISLILIYFVIKPYLENKKYNIKFSLIIGFVFGLSFFLNIAVFLMTGVIFGVLFLLLKNERKNIFLSIIIGVLIALPQYLYIQSGGPSSPISFYPGYLIHADLTLINFLNYWIQNLGLHMILIPLGFIIASKKAKAIFISFFALFIIGNLFKFSPEVAANHKFFNYFMIVGSMFSANFIYFIFKIKLILKPIAIIIVFLLIFSGIIDFFPIFNDNKIVLADYPVNRDISWIMKNTLPNSIFLNTQYLYNNASIAGRKIFLGWPYFSWSQGYDTITRDNLRKSLLNTDNLDYFCYYTNAYNINYVEINNQSDTTVNYSFFEKNFLMYYGNKQSGFSIYNIDKTCKGFSH